MIPEKRISARVLMQQLDDVLTEIADRSTVFFVETDEPDGA